MPKSRNRKNHKKKVRAWQNRTEQKKNRLRREIKEMQEAQEQLQKVQADEQKSKISGVTEKQNDDILEEINIDDIDNIE